MDEDYIFHAAIQTPDAEVKRVRCRLWLPKRADGPLRLEFFPTASQSHHFLRRRINPYCFAGRRDDGHSSVSIAASEVWTEQVFRKPVGRRHEAQFTGDPMDLRVLTSFRERQQSRRGRMTAAYRYFITPSQELTPVVADAYGKRAREILRPVEITIGDGRRLEFDTEESLESRDDEIVIHRQLVAAEERRVSWRQFQTVDEPLLNEVDDLLAVVSFASRHRVTCIGYEATTQNGDRLRYYRRNVTVPERRKQHHHEAVVDLMDFDAFIAKAFRRFLDTGPDESIRHALHAVVPREDRTVESAFTTTYSAVEALVLWHRRLSNYEFAMTDDDWLAFRADLVRWLSQYPTLSGTQLRKKQLSYLRANIDGLRRIPFSFAFSRFLTAFGVAVDDLWPVVRNEHGVGLSDVRNRLVHGSVLSRSELSALAVALDHIRWTLERMLLRVFDWDITKSNVSPDWLRRNRSSITEFPAARRAFRHTRRSVEAQTG